MSKGPCAKQVVTATIVAVDGRRVVGRNDVANPQAVCPRGDMPTGTGYELCKSICRQGDHAEVAAIKRAVMEGVPTFGATLYLEGHSYACEPCTNAACWAGLAIVIGPPPAALDA